ncbi:MAG: hypothetical protein KDA45_07120, partial [Planctomycetales bacterium]|nr:hypothetical protein [Planctomycetales bacterium]
MKSQLNCLALLLVGLLQHIAGAQTNARFQTRPAASRSAAESSTASATSVSADLLAIYQKTKTANNESTITSLARGCAQIVADTQRSRVDRDYAANLLAWGLNRRGEMRNERAAELVAAGQLAEANQL